MDNAALLKAVNLWINEFKCVRTSTEDEARSGRPVEVTTKEILKKFGSIIMKDHRVKVYEIAETAGISAE